MYSLKKESQQEQTGIGQMGKSCPDWTNIRKPNKNRKNNNDLHAIETKHQKHCACLEYIAKEICTYFISNNVLIPVTNTVVFLYCFFLQEKSRFSVNLKDVTDGLQTAVTERNTCTFTRRTSHTFAKCVTSPTPIPAPYANTWRYILSIWLHFSDCITSPCILLCFH